MISNISCVVCECPTGYTGTSCEKCSFGYRKLESVSSCRLRTSSRGLKHATTTLYRFGLKKLALRKSLEKDAPLQAAAAPQPSLGKHIALFRHFAGGSTARRIFPAARSSRKAE